MNEKDVEKKNIFTKRYWSSSKYSDDLPNLPKGTSLSLSTHLDSGESSQEHSKSTTGSIQEFSFSSDNKAPRSRNGSEKSGIDRRSEISSFDWHLSINELDKIQLEQPALRDFQLMKMVGKGGFAKVYLAKRKHDGRMFALKVMRKDAIKKMRQVRDNYNT